MADARSNKTDAEAGPAQAAPRRRAILAPILWLGAGCALTLTVVLVLRATDGPAATNSASPSSASRAPPSPASSRGALGPSGEEFAQLYMAYLLKSYYVDARGFCPNLLRAICAQLVTTDLLANEKSCATLPNADLVLAIGRYQNGVGLPIDGKAGPETVRMILGGSFGSRREMTKHYCSGVAPSAEPAPSP